MTTNEDLSAKFWQVPAVDKPDPEYVRSAVSEMMSLQKELNSRVSSDWMGNGSGFRRAGWIECAEAMDHFGWKWWADTESDRDQFIGEVVDIFHFILCVHLTEVGGCPEKAGQKVRRWELGFSLAHPRSVEYVVDQIMRVGGDEAVLTSVEKLASAFLGDRDLLTPFVRLCHVSGLSFEELYRRYVFKYALNLFRQDFGYADGSYSKKWQWGPDCPALEDNEVLQCIYHSLEEIPAVRASGAADIPRTVYGALSEIYCLYRKGPVGEIRSLMIEDRSRHSSLAKSFLVRKGAEELLGVAEITFPAEIRTPVVVPIFARPSADRMNRREATSQPSL